MTNSPTWRDIDLQIYILLSINIRLKRLHNLVHTISYLMFNYFYVMGGSEEGCCLLEEVMVQGHTLDLFQTEILNSLTEAWWVVHLS